MSASIVKELEKRRIMPLQERERLRAEIARDESDMKGDFPEVSRAMKKHTMKHPSVDIEHAAVNVKALKQKMRALKQGEHPPLTRAEVIALEKEGKRLTEWCQKRMVPVEDSRLSPNLNGASNPDFARAASNMAKGEMSQEFLGNAHKLKNILRLLGKDDPHAGNLEHIRPRRGQAGSQ